MDFLDEDPAPPTATHDAPARRRRDRRPPRPPRQQILVRRGIALGAGLLVLILLVLGVRGCLDARKERALEDYARDVSTLVEETRGTRESFFTKLEGPGSLSVQDFINEVNADSSAMDSYLSRVESLDVPGDMGAAQEALELTYELRAGALADVAEQLPTALGEAGRERAIEAITDDMRALFASDRLFEREAQPEMAAVLEEEGIDAEIPESQFVPDGIVWLDDAEVDSALGQVSGSTEAVDDGLVHGLGLVSASLDGVALQDGVPVTVEAGGTPQLDVEVMNQGEADESGVTVTVGIDGGDTLEEQIGSIAATETQTVSIPLTPAPSGSVTLEVEVEPVPGEEIEENNVASYPVTFG